PAFVEYAGSTTLRAETASEMTEDIVRSLARHGPRRFYILNTGVSTERPPREAAEQPPGGGILVHHITLRAVIAPVEEEISEQKEGTHADEIETSMMVYIDPRSVDMSKAAREYPPRRRGGLTPDPDVAGMYSPTGIYGDATLATRAKGERIVEGTV